MKLIAAIDNNWNIGNDGKLLVHIPQDMRFFKEKTMGKIIIMGRKTLESFPGKKPLKGRVNIVLTSNRNYSIENAIIVNSLDELIDTLPKLIYASHDVAGALPNPSGASHDAAGALPNPSGASHDAAGALPNPSGASHGLCENDVFVIGGGSIYRQLLPYCDTAYITKVNISCQADTFIPNLDEDPEWILRYTRKGGVHDGMEYKFCTYLRRKKTIMPTRSSPN